MVAMCAAFLVGCGAGDVAVQIPRPMGEGNDGRIQQYLEEDVVASESAVCSFDMLHQPGGNVVEVWALCQEAELAKMGTEVAMGEEVLNAAVKITFANPTLDVVGEGEESIVANFSKEAQTKIQNSSYDLEEWQAENLARAKTWLLGE